ncbi:MAG: rod-binding protein [Desulfosarcinaceae bacterium]|nr:rod-binding protein [Desulfosarcinaceae bacterium]
MADGISRMQMPYLRQAQYVNRSPKEAPTAQKTPQDQQLTQLKQACDSFEALFLQQMLKQMRATIPKDGMFSGGSAEQMYSEMLDAELGQEMAAGGGLGISRLLFEHVRAAQADKAETKD